ncbi:hypothetical protein Scep_008055 [Stephania cephalantha]|uniref:Exosome complex exonuclease RRP46 homolog n=1 Tax=Stephania cephalantha TaxID=152367 RepID=A0AAP0KCR0_9MAGN
MEIDRADGRQPNQLRPLSCSHNFLNRAHGSARWSHGDTTVIAAVYGPKSGKKTNENPKKASVEVVWKPNTGHIGRDEKEYEIVVKRTLESICLLTVNPSTTVSVILQVVDDDGGLLPCAINAACAALVDAGIPLKHLAVSICCGLTESGFVVLDPTKSEEQSLQAFTYLVFPNSFRSVLPGSPLSVEIGPFENGIITSTTHGVMSVENYLFCIERGRSASAALSEFLRKSLTKWNESNS